ncbi:MAG: MFS transporter [Ignavibacteria bacterium]|nr:MFS transporter [Ignavibacteria bacterium]
MFKRNLVFISSCFGMLIFGIVLITLGSILPSIISRFSLNEISAGGLVSILPFGILAGSLIFGPIVDHYGYKSLLVVCSILILLGLQGIAYANSFFILQVSIFLIGFGGGLINGGTNALVADISSEYKGANLSLLGVFFGIGALGMPIVLGALSKFFSYQTIISIVGFFILVPITFFVSIKFPIPKQPQGFPLKEGLKLITEPTLLLIGFILFFQSGMEGIINNWTTTYIQNVTKVELNEALITLTFFVLGMTITRFFLGTILKKMQAKIILIASVITAFVGCLIAIFTFDIVSSTVALFLIGCGLAGTFPLMMGFVGELYSSLTGTAFSLVLVIALIGNMILNYSVGIITHNFGVQQIPFIIIVSLVLTLILILIVLKRIKTINN